MASPNILVVADSLEVQQAFASSLGQRGLAPIVASAAREAEAVLGHHSIALVFCSDELLGGGIDGLIRTASQPPNNAPVVVVSRFDDWERCLSFLRCGALDYVLYPLSEVEIEQVVKNALSLDQLRKVQQSASAGQLD